MAETHASKISKSARECARNCAPYVTSSKLCIRSDMRKPRPCASQHKCGTGSNATAAANVKAFLRLYSQKPPNILNHENSQSQALYISPKPTFNWKSFSFSYSDILCPFVSQGVRSCRSFFSCRSPDKSPPQLEDGLTLQP